MISKRLQTPHDKQPPPINGFLISPTAIVAPTPAASSLAAMMATMVMVMPTTTTAAIAPLILRRILQLAARDRTTDHTQDRVSAHLLPSIATS